MTTTKPNIKGEAKINFLPNLPGLRWPARLRPGRFKTLNPFLLRLLFTLISISFSFQAFSNENEKKNLFYTQVIEYYKTQTSKLHEKNLAFIERGEFDSVATSITIDLSRWSFNLKKNSWEMAGASPADENFPVTSGHFYYKKDLSNGVITSDISLTAAGNMQEFNQYSLDHKNDIALQSKTILIYNINILSLPLFNLNYDYDNSDIDTTISLFDNLKKLNISSDEMWLAFKKENQRLGESIFKDVYESRSEQYPKAMLIFNTFSQTVPIKGINKNFRYYNFFPKDETDELSKSLDQILRTYLYDPSFQTGDVIEAFIATINCKNFAKCDGVFFETPEASNFWHEFTVKATAKGLAYFEEHKLQAIEMATRIETMTNRDLAGQVADNAICYIDPESCDANANLARVATASDITFRYLAAKSLALFSNIDDITFAIHQDKSEIVLKFSETVDDATTEMEVAFSADQDLETMTQIMYRVGITRENNYDFYLFTINEANTWHNLGYWYDNYYNKTPPLYVNIIAGIATGPAGAVYGWCTGHDMLTGDELTGWDYVFNAFDLIGATSVVGELGTAFFRSVKVTKAGKVFDLAANKNLYKAYHSTAKAFTGAKQGIGKAINKCLNWGVNALYDEAGKFLKLVDETGQELGRIFKNKIEVSSTKLVPAGAGEAFPLANDVDVFVDGQKSTGKYELVKTGEGKAGLRVIEGLSETIRGVSKSSFKATFEASEELKDEAWELFKQEKWADLENLVNTHSINGGWPPNFGFKNITKIESGDQLANKVFDRFQIEENLGGGFASPVNSGEGVDDLVFTYDSRALKNQIGYGTYYIKFKFKNNLPSNLEFQTGEALPWFGTIGNADQIKSSLNFNTLTQGVHYEILEKMKFENGQWIKIN